MATHGAVAKVVRLHKERRPDLYCPEPDCLWRTGDGSLCPRHQTYVRDDRVADILAYGMQDARTASGARPAQSRFRERLGYSLTDALGHHEPPAKAVAHQWFNPETGESGIFETGMTGVST